MLADMVPYICQSSSSSLPWLLFFLALFCTSTTCCFAVNVTIATTTSTASAATDHHRRIEQDDDGCIAPIGEQFTFSDGQSVICGRCGVYTAGVSVSQSGEVVAVSTEEYGVAGDTVLVQVFALHNDEWMQLGRSIEGEIAGEVLSSNALSDDGTILAVGVIWRNDDDVNIHYNGHVRVYRYNATVEDWKQQPADTIVGQQQQGGGFGSSVALSGDGSILAIGASANIGNYEGQVRVFEWNASNWNEKGNPIDGENIGDRFGISVSLSQNGSILAAGEHWKNVDKLFGVGSVRVFEFSSEYGNWTQIGRDIRGKRAGDKFGRSVSLSSDGQTLAIGGGNADFSGHVRVFQLGATKEQWVQLGSTLEGDSAGYSFGDDVSLSGDGTLLAVGASQSRVNNAFGFLRIFQWGEAEDWQRLGHDIAGSRISEKLGSSTAFSRDGSTVAAGSYNTGRPGTARVFQLNRTCLLGLKLPPPPPSPTAATVVPATATQPPTSTTKGPYTQDPKAVSPSISHAFQSNAGFLGAAATAMVGLCFGA